MKTLNITLAKAADINALNAGGDYEAREWFACAHSLTMACDKEDYDVALRHACRAMGIAALINAHSSSDKSMCDNCDGHESQCDACQRWINSTKAGAQA